MLERNGERVLFELAQMVDKFLIVLDLERVDNCSFAGHFEQIWSTLRQDENQSVSCLGFMCLHRCAIGFMIKSPGIILPIGGSSSCKLSISWKILLFYIEN